MIFVGGEPSPQCEGYLKRPPPAGALGSRCFCVHEIGLKVVECSEGPPSRIWANRVKVFVEAIAEGRDVVK
jgi:hypothetical protein